MFNQPQQPQPSLADRLRTQANIVAFVAGTLAKFAEITFFRRDFGSRYFNDLKVAAVFPLILCYALFWPGYSFGGLFLVMLLYVVRCAYHRARGVKRRWRESRGERFPTVHSRYDGVSVLWQRFPKLSEIDVKRKAEPAVMLAMGIAALVISSPMGWFFIWTAAGMLVNVSLLHRVTETQAQDLTDAAIESGQLAARSREIGGGYVRIHRRTP